MCEHGNTKMVSLCRPRETSGRVEVPVDECIAEEVQFLNDVGIITVGCCCGHGTNNKSILIHELSVSDAKKYGYNPVRYAGQYYDIGGTQ